MAAIAAAVEVETVNWRFLFLVVFALFLPALDNWSHTVVKKLGDGGHARPPAAALHVVFMRGFADILSKAWTQAQLRAPSRGVAATLAEQSKLDEAREIARDVLHHPWLDEQSSHQDAIVTERERAALRLAGLP